LTCKNRLPYNLYCVGGDVKHCTIQPNPILSHLFILDADFQRTFKWHSWNFYKLWPYAANSSCAALVFTGAP